VILSADKAIAWYIPNRSDLASLDGYLVSITELEGKLGDAMVGIDAPESLRPVVRRLHGSCQQVVR